MRCGKEASGGVTDHGPRAAGSLFVFPPLETSWRQGADACASAIGGGAWWVT